MRFLPNWFYGLLPDDLWPDNPREFYNYTLNAIPLLGNGQINTDVVFSKKTDSIIFGASALVTDTTGATSQVPSAGVWSRKLVQLSNSGSGEIYTDPTAGTPAAPGVPFENVFGVWGSVPGGGINSPGMRLPCYWPMPIIVRRGGALSMKITDLSGANHHLRITFHGALIYKKTLAEVA